MSDKLDDASLAVFLGLSDEEAAVIIPKLAPEKRAVFDRMADVCADLNMGVIPDGVIVCRDLARSSGKAGSDA